MISGNWIRYADRCRVDDVEHSDVGTDGGPQAFRQFGVGFGLQPGQPTPIAHTAAVQKPIATTVRHE